MAADQNPRSLEEMLAPVKVRSTEGETLSNKSCAKTDLQTARRRSALYQIVVSHILPMYSIHWPLMQTRLETPEAVRTFADEIARVMSLGRVTTDQIKFAIEQAPARKYYPYPVARDWLELCEEYAAQHMPNIEAVLRWFKRYSDDRNFLADPERDFPWPCEVMRPIVTELHAARLPQSELRKVGQRLIKDWTERLKAGESIPPIPARIENNRRLPPPMRRYETNTSRSTGMAFINAIRQRKQGQA